MEQWHGTRNGYDYHKCRCADCTEANREAKRYWMAVHRAELAAVQNARQRRRYASGSDGHDRRRALIASLKARPCEDCGVQYPSWVMQFDHRDPATKVRGLSKMANHTEVAIRLEAAKCDVVCANCHANRTYQRQQQRAAARARYPLKTASD